MADRSQTMFSRLGHFVSEHPWAVIAAWAVVIVALRLAAPAWSEVTHDGNTAHLPAHMTTVQAQRRLQEAFPGNKTQSEYVVVIESLGDPLRLDEPRTPGEERDLAAIRALGRQLQAEFADHEFVVEIWTPEGEGQSGAREVIAKQLRAPDGRAAAILIELNQDFSNVGLMPFTEQLFAAVERITAGEDFPSDRLRVAVTGSAAIGSEMLASAAESLRNTELVTVILVLTILLAVYRAPVLVLIPLATIGASVMASIHLLAILAQFSAQAGADNFDFKVFTTTRIFIVVILVGAGTDFCLFLFARFRERLREGHAVDHATAEALGGTGKALLASALTTIVGLGMLSFSEFGKFRHSGPALGMCMLIVLAASVTLAPALLRVLGKFVFWPWGAGSSQPNAAAAGSSKLRVTGWFGRLWKEVGHRVVSRPGLVLLATFAVLTPLALYGANVRTTFDLLHELDASRMSVRGARMLDRHFPPGENSPITIVATLPEPLDVSRANAPGRYALKNFTLFLTSREGVRRVRGFETPLGEPLRRTGMFSIGIQAAARGKTADHYKASTSPWTDRVLRFDVICDHAPFSDESRDLLAVLQKQLIALSDGELNTLETVQGHSADANQNGAASDAQADQPIKPAPGWEQDWRGAEFAFAGATAASLDLRQVVTRDTLRIEVLCAVVVFLVLLAILRRPVVCVFLILSVVFSFLVTIGATQLVFSAAYGDEFFGLDWKVPIFLFVILVAIGEDYNIYFVTRAFEEQARLGPMAGLREAVARTGGIISSCGVIMAGTFVSMMSGTLRGMLELGFALSLGVLLDTFVVRPVLVPAFLALLERFRQRRTLNWL